MATFKVGQRVRIIRSNRGLVGLEAAIVSVDSPTIYPGDDCEIEIDGRPSPGWTRLWSARFVDIAPLTDPKADEFIERIKKLEREPAPRQTEKA